MNNRLNRIPLECFRVFLSAARLRNFSASGRELFITQAAVSQRIRKLEELLETQLFFRSGRTVSLTPQGSYLLRRMDTMFDFLDETLEPFRKDRETGNVSIAASGSVSHLWLTRHLQEFSKSRPEISVRVLTTDSMSELANPTHDLVVLYSKGDHPDWQLTPFLPEVLVPAASQDYLTARGNPKLPLSAVEIAQMDLLDYGRFNPHWITLGDWFDFACCPSPRSKLIFSSYALTLDAALQSQGVVLWSKGFPSLPNEKPLVELTDLCMTSGYQYCLGRPRQKTLSAAASELHDHLQGKILM